MITLIHGEDISASRKILYEEKLNLKGSEVISFDGPKVDLPQITIALSSNSLFFEEKTIIIENLLKGVVSKEKEKIIVFLNENEKNSNIILWEGNNVEKVKINKFFKKAKVIACPLPQLIFQFLDCLGRENTDSLLMYYHEILKQKDAAFVYTMLIRQLRLLIIASELGMKGFEGQSPWMAKKFISQAKYFKTDQLVVAYRNLLNIEYKVKTGQTPYDFAQLIDIFLVSL